MDSAPEVMLRVFAYGIVFSRTAPAAFEVDNTMRSAVHKTNTLLVVKYRIGNNFIRQTNVFTIGVLSDLLITRPPPVAAPRRMGSQGPQ